MRGTVRALRFGRGWLGEPRIEERIEEVPRGARTVRVLHLTPASAPPGRPGWVVLHGITRTGLSHPRLLRFARALAASGAAVAVPEVPEWVRLRLAPRLTVPSVDCGIRTLKNVGVAGEGPVGLVGFSFGAPQAILAASDPEIASRVAGVAAFGGYCDLEHTLRFQLTGRSEWNGSVRRVARDPYGSWIVAANFLDRSRGYGDASDVARALRKLADVAGTRLVDGADPSYDPLKARLRREVAEPRRALYDTFAGFSTRQPDLEAADEIVPELVAAARRHAPRLDPGPHLEDARGPIHLLHGRHDRLIPYAETLRLAARLPRDAVARVTVTGLFSHSETRHGSAAGTALEAVRLLAALGRLLTVVRPSGRRTSLTAKPASG